MILVCVTDQQSSDRLIYAGYRLSQKNKKPMRVITARPRNISNATNRTELWLASPEIQYLSDVCSSLDVEFHFVFSNNPAKAVGEYVLENAVDELVISQAPVGTTNVFAETILNMAPGTAIHYVDKKGKIIQQDQVVIPKPNSGGNMLFD